MKTTTQIFSEIWELGHYAWVWASGSIKPSWILSPTCHALSVWPGSGSLTSLSLRFLIQPLRPSAFRYMVLLDGSLTLPPLPAPGLSQAGAVGSPWDVPRHHPPNARASLTALPAYPRGHQHSLYLHPLSSFLACIIPCLNTNQAQSTSPASCSLQDAFSTPLLVFKFSIRPQFPKLVRSEHPPGSLPALPQREPVQEFCPYLEWPLQLPL